ncbi:MAG TPA: DUF4384 domain-containing protein [Gemmatimonadales bacterium]|jgi:hypothetical protein|nr:DUF4384 domain-containing protein [Gemmatimonadales bacterium]
MFLALLLSLAPAVAQADDPPVRVQINHEQFYRGDRARVYVQTERDGHLLVLHADPDGRVRVLFPLDPTDDDFVRGGRRQEIRGRSGRDAFFVDGEDGSGTVLAALSPDPFRYDAFVRNGHWDYRALGAGNTSLKDDPLAGLVDIVQRMAGETRFEYDAATYIVGRQIASRYGYGSYYGYGYPYRFRFGLSFGYPYRYGYFNDPFYDPFCYDPFWSWTGSCYFPYAPYAYGFGYSGFYYSRPYVYGRTYLGGGFVSRGSRFVIPRDRVRDSGVRGIQPRPRVGSADVGRQATSRGVQPRERSPRATSTPPRARDGGGSRSAPPPRVSRGGSSGSGSRPSVSRGSSGASRPASRPSNGGGGGRRRG